jgi:hypothetical protein
MKMKSAVWVASILCLVTSVGCNVNVQEGNGSNGALSLPVDSNTTIVTHSESHSESSGGFEIKGSMHSESNATVHTTTKAVRTLSLAQRVDQWSNEIFPDYKKVEMDPMEAYPKYKSASETIFSRIRTKNPISNAYGKAIYPKLLLKAYRFGSQQALTKEVEAWLNSLGSATKEIQLGQHVDAVKSAPTLCAIIDEDFFLVQTACLQEGKEWTASKELFIQSFSSQGASYIWEIKCGGGEIIYQAGGNE